MVEEPDAQERVAQYRRQRLDECRGRRFLLKTFAAFPSLRSVEEAAWDDRNAYHYSIPYTGQEYDAEEFEMLEDGWDHEHCHVCMASIEPGDEYWQDVSNRLVNLCLDCYRQLTGGGPSPRTVLEDQ
jgi:hypothetical protein